MDISMSKQEKIEAAAKAKALKAAIPAGTGLVLDTTAFEKDSVSPADRFWNIKGTSYYSRDKGLLKGLRRILNLKAGVNEDVADMLEAGPNDTNVIVDKIAAVPAKDWPFKITKGPAHPRLNG
jgi:hypothetical protein